MVPEKGHSGPAAGGRTGGRQTSRTGGVYLGLLAGSLFWGTSFAAAKLGLRELSPLNLVIARFSLASLLFVVILGLGRERPRIRLQDVPRFLLLGFLVISSYFYIQFVALRFTTSIVSSLIIAFSPVFTALISHGLGRERLKVAAMAGIAIALSGVALIITHGRWEALLRSNSLKGDALLLLNALVWSGFTIYGQRLVQDYRPVVAIAYVQIAGTLPLLPLAFFATRLAPVPLCVQVLHLSWPTCLAVLFLAGPCSVFAYQGWSQGGRGPWAGPHLGVPVPRIRSSPSGPGSSCSASPPRFSRWRAASWSLPGYA